MSLLDFQPPVIAHRGASGYAPENTIIAFKKAADLGVKWIEFDVMQAKCGTNVIFHDDTLERTTTGRGRLDQLSFQELITLDAGKWFHPQFSEERIPSLVDVLNFLSTSKLSANVELKPALEGEEKLVESVLQEVGPYLQLQANSLLFSSFSIETLYTLRKYSAECLIGVLFDEWRDDWQLICEDLNAVSVHVNYQILTPELATKIKRANKKLLCYTVNDPAIALQLYRWGVDAVFTDVPDIIINSLNKG